MYAAKQDLVARFGENELIQLTDRTNAGIIDETVLEQAINDANAEINGYLGGRYQLPLAIVPASIKPLCCDIARYKLYDDQSSEQVNKRYDAAIRFLSSVSKGHISLGIDTGGEKAIGSDLAEIQSAGSLFARAKSTGFI